MVQDLSYLTCPLPSDIQQLYTAGEFEEMNRLIQLRLQDPKMPKALHDRLRFASLCAEEIPAAYPFSKSEIFQQMQNRIRGIPESELQALTDDRTLDWHYVSGTVHYRRNCINNLLRTRKEYADREISGEIRQEEALSHQAIDEMIHMPCAISVRPLRVV